MDKGNKGFTLIEMLLVVGLMLLISIGVLRQQIKSAELAQADMAGAQIKEIGSAVDQYITTNSGSLLAASNTTITIADLQAANFLPTSYSGNNIYGSPYQIRIHRFGTGTPADPYKLGGFITTNPVVDRAGVFRPEWLGRAVTTAGMQAGSVVTSASVVNGYKGAWLETSGNFSNISQIGQLAYRTYYGNSNDAVYLRRDGLYPMVGNLDMGAKNINNATNVAAAGQVSGATGVFTGNVTAGGQVTANWVSANSVFATNSSLGTAVANSMTVAGNAKTNSLTVTGDGTVGGNLTVTGNSQIDGTATIKKLAGSLEVTASAVVSAACSPNNRIAMDAAGNMLSCRSGIWAMLASIPVVSTGQGCNSVSDTLGVSTDRKTVFGCQSNSWQLTAGATPAPPPPACNPHQICTQLNPAYCMTYPPFTCFPAQCVSYGWTC